MALFWELLMSVASGGVAASTGIAAGALFFLAHNVQPDPFVIIANEGITLEAVSATTVGDVAQDALWPPQNTSLVSGMIITTSRERIITLASDGIERRFPVFAQTVGQAVGEAGETLGPRDRTMPDVSAAITPEMRIVVVRVNEEERVEKVAVPFPVISRENPELPFRTKRIVERGTEGIAEQRVRVRIENGAIVSRAVLASTVLEAPQPQIEEVGTKITVGKTAEGIGSWYRFRKGMFAAATLFPRGAYLRVTNLENGRQVVVSVNDYGPTAPGRVIDLEATAFQALGKPLWKGLMQVRVEEILNTTSTN